MVRPVAAEVFGVEVDDLPDGGIPVEVVAIVKLLDEDGDTRVCLRSSDGFGSNSPELLGHLRAAVIETEEQIRQRWRNGGDDEDEEGSDELDGGDDDELA